MQALQTTLQTIKAQLSGLSPSAKLLIGSLMVILVMSLFLVSQYAGKQTMSSLGLGPNVSPEAREQALAYLQRRNINHQEQGGDILVPVDEKYAILAELTEHQVISGEQINFDTLMSDDNPFLDRHSKNKRYLIAKMNVLASMISQMNGIDRATVVIDQPEGASGIGKSHVASSASVNVVTSGGDLSQTQVDAIAQLVSRSHAGLKTDNVAIIDARTGKAMFCRSNDALSATKYLDVKTAAEQHAKDTLELALEYIPGVRIAVNAQVDTTEVTQRKSTVDDPKVGPTSENTQTTVTNNASNAAEPAVRPNTGASIASGKSGSSMSDERSESTTIPVFGQTESQIKDGRGYPLQINATVGIPRSYFVRLYRSQQPAGGDPNAQPDSKAMDALIASETDKIKAYVTPLIDTQAIDGAKAGVVTVGTFEDFGATAALISNTGEGAASTGIGGGMAGGIGGAISENLVKYISLGSLAAIALAMMFMMVRKAAVRQELPSAQELVGIPPALTAAESDLVGEADEASPALEGVEINEDSLRRQQMLDQITDMVNKSPDEAASLMRRWIRSDG